MHIHFHFPTRSKLSLWFRSTLDYLQPSEDTVLLITAIVVGLGTGFGAVFFRYLIDAVDWLGYNWMPRISDSLGNAYIIFVPALGGLLVGLLVYNFAPEAKGHGVPEVMEAVALRGGRIRPIVAVVKSLASALTIGSGGAAGREGPIVQIGSALGSTIGQMLHLSEDRVRNLVACGAAGGIAATFNAPIAGVFFALEIILGAFSVQYFSTVVISAVVASVIGRVAFGDVPAFLLPSEYGVNSLWEYAFYPFLGLAAAFFGAFYTHLLYWTEDIFDNLKRLPPWIKPAIGGGLLGLLALSYPPITGVEWDAMPHIFNVGYGWIEAALANDLLLRTALILMVLKLLAVSLTLGSGGSGGVFAPSLFMGAMLGLAFAQIMHDIFPNIITTPGAYALLGMAAVFAATAHAPITAIIILSELTNDHRIILPLMLTVIVATLVSRALLKNDSIYTLKLSRRGVYLERGHDIDLMQGVLVGEAMIMPPPTIEKTATLIEMKARLRELNIRSLCIVDEAGDLLGISTLGDLQQHYEYHLQHKEIVDITTLTVGDICRPNPITVYDDDVLWTAIRTMGTRDIGQLPVLKSGTRRLIGMVTRHNVMNAYNVAITRKMRNQHRAEQMRLNILTGAHVIEITIEKNMTVVGKKIQDLSLPEECLIAVISRKRKLIVPHDYTELLPGDSLTIVAEVEAEAELRALFTPSTGATKQ
jgi:chloride channel protein, CIC family